jgi:hypothetical protein
MLPGLNRRYMLPKHIPASGAADRTPAEYLASLGVDV